MKNKSPIAAVLVFAFAGGAGVGWMAHDYVTEQSGPVSRQTYQDMATQSKNNLNSFLEAQNQIVKLEAELAECRAKHK